MLIHRPEKKSTVTEKSGSSRTTRLLCVCLGLGVCINKKKKAILNTQH